MTGVLNESSLLAGKEQEELLCPWLLHPCRRGGCWLLRAPAEPQAMGTLLLPSTGHQHEWAAKGCLQTQNAGAGFSFADGFIAPGWEGVELLALGCECHTPNSALCQPGDAANVTGPENKRWDGGLQ